jgi:DNA transposition AAA+ family ATPase
MSQTANSTLEPKTDSEPPAEYNPISTTRVGIWHIAGDQMTRGTFKYKDEVREPLRWFYEVCRIESISMTQAAKILGLSPSTLSKVYSGNYEGGNPRTVAQAINSYRRVWNERQSVIDTGFTKTTISEKIFSICNLALKYKAMGLIIGPSQIGKTTALQEYTRLNNHGRTKFVRVPVAAGIYMVLQEIARACRISPNSSVIDLRQRICNALDENTLIIIDEVHQTFSTCNRKSRMKIIEMLREIHDLTKCGMVLCATPIFEHEMVEGKLKELMEQLSRRCVYRVHLKDAVKLPDKDIISLSTPFGLKEIDDESLEIVRTVLQISGIGMYVRFLQAGKELAKNKKQTFSWKHFIEAHDIIKKGWMK